MTVADGPNQSQTSFHKVDSDHQVPATCAVDVAARHPRRPWWWWGRAAKEEVELGNQKRREGEIGKGGKRGGEKIPL